MYYCSARETSGAECAPSSTRGRHSGEERESDAHQAARAGAGGQPLSRTGSDRTADQARGAAFPERSRGPGYGRCSG